MSGATVRWPPAGCHKFARTSSRSTAQHSTWELSVKVAIIVAALAVVLSACAEQNAGPPNESDSAAAVEASATTPTAGESDNLTKIIIDGQNLSVAKGTHCLTDEKTGLFVVGTNTELPARSGDISAGITLSADRKELVSASFGRIFFDNPDDPVVPEDMKDEIQFLTYSGPTARNYLPPGLPEDPSTGGSATLSVSGGTYTVKGHGLVDHTVGEPLTFLPFEIVISCP